MTPNEAPDWKAMLERWQKTTPGKWTADESEGMDAHWFDITVSAPYLPGMGGHEIASAETQMRTPIVHKSHRSQNEEVIAQIRANLEFIAHAHTDLPLALAERERLSAEGERLQREIGHIFIDRETAKAALTKERDELRAALKRLIPIAWDAKHEDFSNTAGEEDTRTDAVIHAARLVGRLVESSPEALLRMTTQEVKAQA